MQCPHIPKGILRRRTHLMVMCLVIPSDESNIEAVETSIRKYAKAIVDTLNLYGYDGFDIDYEPVAILF